MNSGNSTSGELSPPPPPTFIASNKFNPSMAIIIVVLIGALLVVLIFSMYIQRCTRGSEESSNRVSPTMRNGNQSIHFFERPGEGLERALVDALPVVSFAVVKTLKAGKEDLECSVCLERFEEDEALRLLPKCSHVFHTECIDVWFLSHSTCPLCRTSLKPTFEEMSAGVPEVGEVSRRILVAQEELFGSGRQADSGPLHPDEAALEGSGSEVVGRGTERDGERNSARLALFRNSDSFRQAARGVEVRERLATLSARYPVSSVDVEKARPQRSSSLSCVNFSLQRTSSFSGNAATAGTGDQFYNAEVIFKYGSQRYGATGSSLNNSLGRLGSLNERELQDQTGDVTFTKPSAEEHGEQEASSSSPSSDQQWTTLDLAGAASRGDMIPKLAPAAVNFDNPDVSTTPDTRQVLPGKPRSGPLVTGKQVTAVHRKSGSVWDQRVRTERGSFRGLRGSFSLHRSASEGRAQIFAVEPLSTLMFLDVEGRPTRVEATTPPAGIDNSNFAQRTIQWLSGGGSKHTRSSSARASSDQRSDLHQIVTE